MTKRHRRYRYRDGRLGYPTICCYVLTGGPQKGKRLGVPPTLATHPDPSSATPPPLSSAEAAEVRAKWKPEPRASWPYRLKVLDKKAYRRLEEAGFWLSPEHRGGAERIIDKLPPGG